MVKYLTGPPGGRTLPLTTTRLADLDGGAYGPGSSVASTGPNAHRAVIKAASARQAGETWEDVLEYYMVTRLTIAKYELLLTFPVVQCRKRRDRFRLSLGEDLLPRFHLC